MSSKAADQPTLSEFDPGLFWDQHKTKIIGLAALILIALVLVATFQVMEHRKREASRALLISATSEADYAALIKAYPRTMSAANAHLLLAANQREAGNYDESIATLESFLKSHPDHSLAGGAVLSLGETQEAAGRTEPAQESYRRAATEYPDSYAAPASLLAAASVFEQNDRTDEARRAYEDLISRFPESYMAQQAQTQLQQLK